MGFLALRPLGVIQERNLMMKTSLKIESSTVLKDPTGRSEFLIPSGASSSKLQLQVGPAMCHWKDDTRPTGVDSRIEVLPSATIDATSASKFRFLKPAILTMKYDKDAIGHLDEKSLQIYRCDFNVPANPTYSEQYPTTVDPTTKTAKAEISLVGGYGLLGKLSCPLDTAEYDDSYWSSRTIGEADAIYYDGPGQAPRVKGTPFGENNLRIFDSIEDEDWFHFEAKRGKRYQIETTDLSSGVQPFIELYKTDGVTLMASAESNLKWTPPSDYFSYEPNRIVFVKTEPLPNSSAGCSAKFNFRIIEE